MIKKRMLLLTGMLTVLLMGLCSCSTKTSVNKNLKTDEPVSLTICGPWTSSKAIENAIQAFCEKYPNCEIKYEFVQNYDESMVTRLEKTPDSVDLLLTQNIQSDSVYFPYVEELYAHEELDLSDTNEALIKNHMLMTSDKSTAAQIYSIPLGGELRGMYVNKTLLDSLGLSIPQNSTEFMAACETLKDAGYVPVHGNPGMLGQRLLYPYVCNLIANSKDYDTLYDQINKCEPGVSELFREPMQFMYDLTSNYYYNYKYVETELNMFTDNSDEGCARYFFNVLEDGSDFTKQDDLGTIAFMPGTLTQKTTMDKTKDDYHSNIEYEFILSPVSEDGGFAYLSPGKCIAVNKETAHMDWAVEFMNFLFESRENTTFANDIHYIPNTKDAMNYIKKEFDVPEDHISDLGQMTFDYGFYSIIDGSLVNISKGNNPKYMDVDDAGNPVMYSFDYYMEQLEAAFAEQREGGTQE